MRINGKVGRKVAGVVAAVGSSLLATPSWALCPNCLGQSPTLSPALRIVGLFLLVPPAIFFAVAIAIQKLSRPNP
jgi:hypothetical protein